MSEESPKPMPFSSRSYVNRYVPSNRFPTGVKWLLIITITISVLDILFQGTQAGRFFFGSLSLIPSQVVFRGGLWRLVTYLFLHGSVSPILWNMLALWMIGSVVERTWGTRRFVTFYLTCGAIAAVIVVLAAYLFGGVNVPVVGSTGAVLGILSAFAVLFPDQSILFGFLIPIKTKYFVMIVAGAELLIAFVSVRGGAAVSEVVAGLGGLAAGYLLLRGRKLRGSISVPLRAEYKDWKLRRARKKFEVYLRKKDSNRDRWVH